MHYRTHPRIGTFPALVMSVAISMIVLILLVPQLGDLLREQMPILPWLAIGAAALVLAAFFAWFMVSIAEVRRGELRVRSIRARQRLDLRALAAAEVHARSTGGSRRTSFQLILRLEDREGRELWLPLSTWRDEDLLVARVLRATVDNRIRIDGDPLVVRRFSGLLDTYKSWDRRQAAA